MPKITPNFHFAGQCADAIALYTAAFGARVGTLLHYSDARKEDLDRKLTEKEKNYVYHCELFIGEQRIMLADHLDLPFQTGTSLL